MIFWKTRLFCALTLLSGVVDEVFRHLQVLRSSIRVCSSAVAAAASSLWTHTDTLTVNQLRKTPN